LEIPQNSAVLPETIFSAKMKKMDNELLQKLNLELGGSLKNHQVFFKITEQDLTLARANLASLINPLL